jgi:hypothetical protein
VLRGIGNGIRSRFHEEVFMSQQDAVPQRTDHSGAKHPGESGSSGFFASLALAQGLYYAASGLWPLVSIDTFQKVTGPKTDLWLVKTVGVLVGVTGGVLITAARRRQVTPEIPLLAAGSAAGLAAIDITYVAKRRISPIYLLDALAELALVGCWAFGRPRAAKKP